MITVTHFFLLRPVDYNRSKYDYKPFYLEYVALSCGRSVFTATATEADLQSTTFVTLALTNQKNRVRTKKIIQNSSEESILCPKSALLWRFLLLRANNVPPSTPLARITMPIRR